MALDHSLPPMRFLIWSGVEEWLTEAAQVELDEGGLRAKGIQLGAEPAPFRVDYRLEAPGHYVTSELELTATAEHVLGALRVLRPGDDVRGDRSRASGTDQAEVQALRY